MTAANSAARHHLPISRACASIAGTLARRHVGRETRDPSRHYIRIAAIRTHPGASVGPGRRTPSLHSATMTAIAAPPRVFSGIQPSGVAAHRQRSGRDPQLRRAAGPLRRDHLHRRLPRADEHATTRSALRRRTREMAADAPRARPRPEALHALRAVAPARGHRAHVALHDGHARVVARTDADLQGQAREPARRRQPRPADLPGPAGGRHRPLQGVARARRQGPGGAPRAVARDRARGSTRCTATRSRSRRRSSPRRRWCSAPTASAR